MNLIWQLLDISFTVQNYNLNFVLIIVKAWKSMFLMAIDQPVDLFLVNQNEKPIKLFFDIKVNIIRK